MSVHVGYTVTDSTVPHGGSGTPTVRLTQSYTPTKPLQIILRPHRRLGHGFHGRLRQSLMPLLLVGYPPFWRCRVSVSTPRPQHRRPDPKATYTFPCDRCGRLMHGPFGLSQECLLCVQEAKKVWPGLGALKWSASGV